MRENPKHLKLNIKGTFKNLLAKWQLHRNLKAMGVSIKDIKHLDANEVEIHVSGDKNNLWNVVNWSKGSGVFVFLNEVVFEFVEA